MTPKGVRSCEMQTLMSLMPTAISGPFGLQKGGISHSLKWVAGGPCQSHQTRPGGDVSQKFWS